MKLYRWILTLSLTIALSRGGRSLFWASGCKTKAIYNESANARVEIKEALHKATAGHKRVIVSLRPTGALTATPSTRSFIARTRRPSSPPTMWLLHVDIGKGKKNQDLMTKYEVPMKRGIPGLAVLDADGKLVYTRRMASSRMRGPSPRKMCWPS